MPTKKTEPDAAATKPARSRRAVVTEPEALTPEPKPDRTMMWALSVLAAIVVFGGGYLVGHATADDSPDFEGHGQIVIAGSYPEGLPMFPGASRHHMSVMPGIPGMLPLEIYPMPQHCGSQSETVSGQGYLGIRGVDTQGAVMIVEVVPGSPADEAGITSGDLVISFSGTSIESMAQLADLVRVTEPGTEVEVLLHGPDGGRAVTVVVGARPGE